MSNRKPKLVCELHVKFGTAIRQSLVFRNVLAKLIKMAMDLTQQVHPNWVVGAWTWYDHLVIMVFLSCLLSFLSHTAKHQHKRTVLLPRTLLSKTSNSLSLTTSNHLSFRTNCRYNDDCSSVLETKMRQQPSKFTCYHPHVSGKTFVRKLLMRWNCFWRHLFEPKYRKFPVVLIHIVICL